MSGFIGRRSGIQRDTPVAAAATDANASSIDAEPPVEGAEPPGDGAIDFLPFQRSTADSRSSVWGTGNSSDERLLQGILADQPDLRNAYMRGLREAPLGYGVQAMDQNTWVSSAPLPVQPRQTTTTSTSWTPTLRGSSQGPTTTSNLCCFHVVRCL